MNICELCGRELSENEQAGFCSPAHREAGVLVAARRSQLEAEHKVENGRIGLPGPFQAAEVFVPYFWEQMLGGRGFRTNDVAYIEIGPVERKVFPELGTAFAIWLGQTGPALEVEYALLETEDEFDEAVCLEMTGLASAACDDCGPKIVQ